MVCLLAAPWVQLSVSAGNRWPQNALMPVSCHFRISDCKALLVTSLTHVSGAIASVPTFTFAYTFTGQKVDDALRLKKVTIMIAFLGADCSLHVEL